MRVLKLVKTMRYLRARLKPASALPLYWHIGRPNFGDDINPSFFGQLCKTEFRFVKNQRQPHFVGIGSILERVNSNSIVVGSGFLRPPQETPNFPLEIVCLRGELSRSVFPKDLELHVGDPMVLIDRYMPPQPKRRGIALIPHMTNVDRARKIAGSSVEVIDPAADPWTVIADIAASEAVMSQSLHGLVVADALGIPNIWIEPTPSMAGGRFKFDDYFSTLDKAKEVHEETEAMLRAPPKSAFSVGRYTYDKAAFAEHIQMSVSRWKSALGPRG